MTEHRPLILRADTAPPRLQELPAGDLLPADTLGNALKVLLQGLVTGNNAGITSADTVLQALGKLQAQASAKVDKDGAKVLSDNNFTNAERVKLANIADAATKNRADAELLNRANHTGGFNGYGASNDMRNGTVLPASAPPSAFFGQGSITGLAKGDELGTPVAYYGIFRCDSQWIDASAGYGVSRSFSSEGRKFESYALPANTWSAWVETTNRANQFGEQAISTVTGLQAALDAKASAFADVPTTQKAPVIFVTQPHFRTFVWNGTKYVRAPWDRPGVLFFSHAPAANVTHGIQVRADVTYNTADHPDLAEILGVSGSTFILPEGRARVLRAADNGRGIDAALVNGYLQEDAGRNLSGYYYMSDISGGNAWGTTGNVGGAFKSLGSAPGRPSFQGYGIAGDAFGLVLDASLQWPTANEFRVKSLTATLYITR